MRQGATHRFKALAKHKGSADPLSSATSELLGKEDDPIVIAESPAKKAQEVNPELAELIAIFPDCDPNHLWDLLENMKGDAERVAKITNTLLENRDYPKIAKTNPSPSAPSAPGNFKLQDFEGKDFYKTDTPMAANYVEHCTVELSNSFPLASKQFIRSVMAKHNNHFLPSLRELEKVVKEKRKGYKPVPFEATPADPLR